MRPLARAARSLWFMAGQWPAEVLDSMKYNGEHLEILLALNHNVGLIRADTRHPWTDRPLHMEDVWTEPVRVVSRSILMVPLKAPGEHTTALNDSLPCVFNDSQMCFRRVHHPWCYGKERPWRDEVLCATPPVARVILVKDDRLRECWQGASEQSSSASAHLRHNKSTGRCSETQPISLFILTPVQQWLTHRLLFI